MPAKLEAAGMHTSPVVRQAIQETRRVPGRIGYNPARRLELKVPVAGVVKQVLAGPGQPIHGGDRLAVLTSVEVGLARDAVIKSEADVQLAQKDSSWADQISDNLADLLKLLDTNPTMPYAESHFRDGCWATTATKSSRPIPNTCWRCEFRKIPTHWPKTVHSASAWCKNAPARAKWRPLTSRAFASNRVSTRCSSSAASAPNSNMPSACWPSTGRSCNCCSGHSPRFPPKRRTRRSASWFCGRRWPAWSKTGSWPKGPSSVASQNLFSVVNTETLWVSAQIYEREWAALADLQAREILVETPALPGRRLPARVQFTGVSMAADTRAIPLVAELTNVDGHLKPGMFAWITIPIGKMHDGLVVPAGAVMRQEQETYVFVQEAPATYRKVDVTLGLDTPEMAEITHGLKPGQMVVDQGAFFLKSELLLSLEKDEE